MLRDIIFKIINDIKEELKKKDIKDKLHKDILDPIIEDILYKVYHYFLILLAIIVIFIIFIIITTLYSVKYYRIIN